MANVKKIITGSWRNFRVQEGAQLCALSYKDDKSKAFSYAAYELFSKIPKIVNMDRKLSTKLMIVYSKLVFARAVETCGSFLVFIGFYPDGSDKPIRVIMNTGLLTDRGEYIYFYFVPNHVSHPLWILESVLTEQDLLNAQKMKSSLNTPPVPVDLKPLLVPFPYSPYRGYQIQVDQSAMDLFGVKDSKKRWKILNSEHQKRHERELYDMMKYGLEVRQMFLRTETWQALPTTEGNVMIPISLNYDKPHGVDAVLQLQESEGVYKVVGLVSKNKVLLNCHAMRLPLLPWVVKWTEFEPSEGQAPGEEPPIKNKFRAPVAQPIKRVEVDLYQFADVILNHVPQGEERELAYLVQYITKRFGDMKGRYKPLIMEANDKGLLCARTVGHQTYVSHPDAGFPSVTDVDL